MVFPFIILGKTEQVLLVEGEFPGVKGSMQEDHGQKDSGSASHNPMQMDPGWLLLSSVCSTSPHC